MNAAAAAAADDEDDTLTIKKYNAKALKNTHENKKRTNLITQKPFDLIQKSRKY